MDWDWILGSGVTATKIDESIWLLEAEGNYVVISCDSESGRYLLNGADVEMDESVWGLGDELEELVTVRGVPVRLADPDE